MNLKPAIQIWRNIRVAVRRGTALAADRGNKRRQWSTLVQSRQRLWQIETEVLVFLDLACISSCASGGNLMIDKVDKEKIQVEMWSVDCTEMYWESTDNVYILSMTNCYFYLEKIYLCRDSVVHLHTQKANFASVARCEGGSTSWRVRTFTGFIRAVALFAT